MAVVELFGIPRHRWGIGGVPATMSTPIVSLNVREAALHVPGVDNAPTQLITSITDAVVEVFGESVRRHVTVYVVGVPAGRSGVGGEVDPPPAN
ncbi:hypothetical protein DWB77_00594 [Streptomyces hundungensis]|uniref:4-oxalocrotonate tautomerase domain-containing protein n=1 Tax=Streptomyces hundungensis TaxID=1077946 RepID=A0A387HCL2_9ACTN|nr:tautomerase family protein [Streptomyces hundungensis]AYG78487.1 hypothetical protein DWB77_00594 [Streptomyces hundungensis]